MEYSTSPLLKLRYPNNFLKPFKEDNLIQMKPKTYTKKNIYPIENFVPVIKPKKAFRRPPPLVLNEDNQKQDKFPNDLIKKNCLESDYNALEAFEKDDLASDTSDFSSDENEKIKNDFSASEKSESPIFKYRED